MGKIIKAEKRGGGGIESKVIEEYTPLVYVPQNTTVPQNTSLIYFPYKIWKKGTKYFIQVNVY